MNTVGPRDLADGFGTAQDFHDQLKLEQWRIAFAVFLGHHQSLLQRLPQADDVITKILAPWAVVILGAGPYRSASVFTSAMMITGRSIQYPLQIN